MGYFKDLHIERMNQQEKEKIETEVKEKFLQLLNVGILLCRANKLLDEAVVEIAKVIGPIKSVDNKDVNLRDVDNSSVH